MTRVSQSTTVKKTKTNTRPRERGRDSTCWRNTQKEYKRRVNSYSRKCHKKEKFGKSVHLIVGGCWRGGFSLPWSNWLTAHWRVSWKAAVKPRKLGAGVTAIPNCMYYRETHERLHVPWKVLYESAKTENSRMLQKVSCF